MKSKSPTSLLLVLVSAFGFAVSAHSSAQDDGKAPSRSTQPSEVVTSKDIALCEKKVKAFLASDYCGDGSAAKKLFTKEFARLWLKVCNSPEGWGADPILETQDDNPKLVRFGPGAERADKIDVPVKYQHQWSRPFTKTFAFTNVGGQWLIADIITSGSVHENGSMFKQLSKYYGN